MSRKTHFALVILASSFLLSGAAVLAEEAAESPLAGTEWRLVEFQSMADSVGTIRPDDPSLYTMRLGEDGTVSMRLNCNRATGTWSAGSSAGGESGSFEFGPLAATRALCPQPSMDERIVKDAEYVRSYLLQGGRLYLSLMADAGIYAWEPATGVPYETAAYSELGAAIRGPLRATPVGLHPLYRRDQRAAAYATRSTPASSPAGGASRWRSTWAPTRCFGSTTRKSYPVRAPHGRRPTAAIAPVNTDHKSSCGNDGGGFLVDGVNPRRELEHVGHDYG